MRKMVKKSAGLYIFQDTSEFEIKPLLNLGEMWTYDAENNIEAIISFVGETEFFGISDSIKNISLSNGKTIVISKNYGILQFPANTENYYEETLL